jgi:predicted regulator of Ras-like GTPase activity (Roadblock/LC7/MglB family)
MSFEPTLQKMIDGCSGAIGIALMGSDGIAVAELQAPDPDLSVLDGEVGAAGIEFGRILDEVRKASDALSGGRLEEVVVGLARFTLVFRVVDDELFLVVALAQGGNLGKARFLMRRHLLELREQL